MHEPMAKHCMQQADQIFARGKRQVVTRPLMSHRKPWTKVVTGDDWDAWVPPHTGASANNLLFSRLLRVIESNDSEIIGAARALSGHGALLAHKDGVTVAMTDVVASVPLYIAHHDDGISIGADGDEVATAAGLQGVDGRAALQVAIAGYTVGRRTLIQGLQSLKPGEIVIVDGNGCRHIRYARYLGEPDEAIDPADPQVMARHNEVLLGLLEQLVSDANGRTIMIPLSGGFDSRAIASGLKLLGYGNVVCFSYGLPGNHEAIGAQRVAARLGYPWLSIDYSPKKLQAFFASETARRFFDFADRPDAMPFLQDVPAIERLRQNRAIPEDAIIVNGQSGDYIAGNHIPIALAGEQAPDRISKDGLFRSIQAKHFDLWKFLETPAAMEAIRADIFADLDDCVCEPMSRNQAAIAYELSEFENRQSKYVVAGQRCYEMFGYDWRMPLWEPALVEYWRRMPLTAKLNRRLFQTALEKANWCRVWGPDWRFPRTVVPAWVRMLRAGVRSLIAPAGKDAWHGAEKHLFEWRSDPIQNYSIVPYHRVLFDRRGFRNALAWHAEQYLARKGISINALADFGKRVH